jgi:hypothetical protein
MGVKVQPNHRSYWKSSCPFLHCKVISSCMSRQRFERISACLHIVDDSLLPSRGQVEHDKLGKLKWLLTELRVRCKENWHLGQYITIDEMMVRYKGKYCPIRQYLPNKPTKWGIKVWCCADARKKYVYDFEVYTGASIRSTVLSAAPGEAKTRYAVVMNLTQGLHHRGHLVFMDNFFTSVKLLMDLVDLGTYGTGTVRSNRVGLPQAMANSGIWKGKPQGSLGWRMHRSRKITCVTWVDKKPVLLLSTHANPLSTDANNPKTVPRRDGAQRREIPTSPVHKAYTKWMRGVDVSDQLRGEYRCQVRSHKWWHRLFFFLLDMARINSWIMHKCCTRRAGKKALEHVNFTMQLAEALMSNWGKRRGVVSTFNRRPCVHSPVKTKYRRVCRHCHSSTLTNIVCPQCGDISLHLGECFSRSHFPLWK